MDDDQWYALAKQPAEWQEGYNAALAELRVKAGKLPRRYRKEHGKWLITIDVADLTALLDGTSSDD
jgi:hypothetical protein